MKGNKGIAFDNTEIAFKAKSNRELKKAFYLFTFIQYPLLAKLGMFLTKLLLEIHFPIKRLIKNTIFEQFCGGESIEECELSISKLKAYKVGTIFDYSVEAADEKHFDQTAHEIIATIERAQSDVYIPFSVFKFTGIASFPIMEKIQKKIPLNDDEKNRWEQSLHRVDAICQMAFRKNVRILIDAEESWIQNTIDEVVYDMMKKYNRASCIVYNTYQMYRTDMYQNLMEAHQLALQNGFFLGAKIVRGAYMEKERKRAERLDKNCLIHPDKKSTDQAYDQALEYCVSHLDRIFICAGTHNEESNRFLVDLMTRNHIIKNHEGIYFSQLYGMSDHISFQLAQQGYHVAKYLPYGPVKAVMPYLFRRAQENTSVKGQSSRELELIKKEIQRRRSHHIIK